MVTNTHSVGVVRDAVVAWMARQRKDIRNWWALPVVAETYDGGLNDINGQHVRPEHVAQAMDRALEKSETTWLLMEKQLGPAAP